MQIPNVIVLAISTLAMASVAAAEIAVPMQFVTATASTESLGMVVITEVAHGLVFTPALSGLPPGLHGFHVHEHASCEPAEDAAGKPVAAMAAGGHYDPEATQRHGSPLWADGHRGDLPVLSVDATGQANTPVLAARLTLADVDNRALMIHAGGDNYSDNPAALGGGGARIACGLIQNVGVENGF